MSSLRPSVRESLYPRARSLHPSNKIKLGAVVPYDRDFRQFLPHPIISAQYHWLHFSGAQGSVLYFRLPAFDY